jgi:hypothetical protein
MTPKRTLICGTICGLALILLTSCDTVSVHRRRGGWIGNGPSTRSGRIETGPPAHAKAHGYRRKQVCGYDLMYDTNWGVYIVVGITDCYYHDGHFYRLRGEDWQISLRADSGWGPASVTLLPPGLQKKATTRARAKAQIAAVPKPQVQGKAQSFGKGKGYAKVKH